MVLEIMVITYALLIFLLIVIFLADKGRQSDSLKNRMKMIEGKGSTKQEAVDELNNTFFDRFLGPHVNKFKAKLDKINSKESVTGKKNAQTKEVEKLLRYAGMDMSAEAYLFYKKSFTAVVAMLSFFLPWIFGAPFEIWILIFLFGVAIGMLIPSTLLTSKGRGRQNQIKYQLADAFDLMGICIEAGLSFDSSMLKVSEKMEGPFIDELLVAYREIQMGVPRNEALKKMSDATDIQELRTFVSALIQANQLGIPINNVMRVQSDQLREARMADAKEQGAKAPVKILLPMVGFIFPVVFIILMAPTVLRIIEMFSQT